MCVSFLVQGLIGEGREASFLTSSFVFAYFVAISLSAIASFNIAHTTYKPCSHFSHNIALITSHYIVQNSKELKMLALFPGLHAFVTGNDARQMSLIWSINAFHTNN